MATRHDEGFSLIELLIVIVVLGIMSTVVVMSVRGITDRGEESSEDIEVRELETALEAYYARYGAYPTESVLVAADMLREESTKHDITVTPDGTDYTIVPTP